jgi:FtsH-binding integral membrane protein
MNSFAFILFLATFYDVDVVIEALLLTTAVVVALFIYSFQTTRDFSAMGASLFSILWVLVIAGILQVNHKSAFILN